MPDLIAQGEQARFRWRRRLPVDQPVVLGRGGGPFSAAWDDRISRAHASLEWRGDRLEVRRLDAARNPVFFDGKEANLFDVSPGEHFVIGQTTFTLADDQVNISLDAPEPLRQQAFSAKYLQQIQFRNARARIEVLSRLPEVISSAASDTELFVRLINLLLSGIPTADAAALVQAAPEGDQGAASDAPIEVLHWDRHLTDAGDFKPSEHLIRESLRTNESVLHVWSSGSEASFTAREDVDWAFCTPVGSQASQGWAIYVAGRFSGQADSGTPTADPTDLSDDLKFTEVVAATLRSLRELRRLERRNAGLSQFFSPIVLETLATEDPGVVLEPRETEVTVLFCDLRGFVSASEKSADDLLGLLNRVSRALGVTTHHILDQGGVVGDFQGDAAMGFWGWPIAHVDAVERAARAALAIRAELERAAEKKDDLLSGFRMGIGIATGRAVADKIGTVDQVKVTVFGPVVNLASRLESMTKVLRAPILIDAPTAQRIREQLPTDVARCRRLAVVRPVGLDTPVEVSELLPPTAEDPRLTDAHLADYEAALDTFQAGDWQRAFELLHRVPADDQAKDFLTVFIAQHDRTPPDAWDGVIPLSTK